MPSAPAPAVLAQELAKEYEPGVGIEGIELEVRRGEVFGFIGPNGAGKTTMIRVLLDLIRPTAGRVAVLGFDAQRESLQVRRRTGYLPGELKLPGAVTSRELLGHLGRLRGVDVTRSVGELAERLGLDVSRRLDELSKGNRQKVGLVAALMHDPELLILDEPTSGLDPLRQRDVQRLLRERAERGTSVFLSSHELDQVEHAADRVGIIRDGRLVAVEGLAELRRRMPRRVEVELGAEAGAETLAALEALPAVRSVAADGRRITLEVVGPMDALVKLLARSDVQTLTAAEAELDEIFISYYGADRA